MIEGWSRIREVRRRGLLATGAKQVGTGSLIEGSSEGGGLEGKGSVPSAVKAILDYIKFPTVVVRSAWSRTVPRERVGRVVEGVGVVGVGVGFGGIRE